MPKKRIPFSCNSWFSSKDVGITTPSSKTAISACSRSNGSKLLTSRNPFGGTYMTRRPFSSTGTIPVSLFSTILISPLNPFGITKWIGSPTKNLLPALVCLHDTQPPNTAPRATTTAKSTKISRFFLITINTRPHSSRGRQSRVFVPRQIHGRVFHSDI